MQEYCEDASFHPVCGPDEVIVMTSARYGRMRLANCLTTNYGHVGCSTDMLPVVDSYCSGRWSCEVDIRDLMVSGQKPCPKDLRSYLEAQYTCLPIGELIIQGDWSRFSLYCLTFLINFNQFWNNQLGWNIISYKFQRILNIFELIKHTMLLFLKIIY